MADCLTDSQDLASQVTIHIADVNNLTNGDTISIDNLVVDDVNDVYDSEDDMINEENDVSVIDRNVTTLQNSDINVSAIVCDYDDNVLQNGNLSILDTSVEVTSNDSEDNDHIKQNVYENVTNVRENYPNNVIIGHLNINSLKSKHQEVKQLLKECRFEMMVLSETKLDPSCQYSLYEIENYCMYRQDKRSNSGGLLAYVTKDIPSTVGPINLCTDGLECISIELNNKDVTIMVLCMYKNPTMKPNDFKHNFEDIYESITDKYEHVIVIGDLNFNMLHSNTLSLLCPTFNLTNIVTTPTCYKSNEPTLIDVMLVSKRRKYIKGFSIDVGISDFHCLVGGILKQNSPIPSKKVVYHRKLSCIDYEKVNSEITLIELAYKIQMENDVNKGFNTLQGTLIDLLDKYAPRKQKIVRSKDFFCMTKKLKKAILVRNQYRNKFFKNRCSYHLALYRKQRNLVTLIKREEIRKYFEDKCRGSTTNKDFWKAVKPIFSKTKTKSNNIPLREDDKIITDCKVVSEIFNKFFREIGADIGNHEDSQRSVDEIIDDFSRHPSVDLINKSINTESRIFHFDEVTENDTRKALKALSTKKASGYDEVPINFLKNIIKHLIKPLTRICNLCIQQNRFPDNMKKANITPLYKKKDKLNKDNYRSINLLISLSKILEKVMFKKIYDFMQPQLHKYLSGFRQGHGCSDVLTRMNEDWRKALDNNLNVGIIAIDLSKAFDCMSHCLLLAKLNAYGFSLNSCKLMQSYLVNRKQRVKIGDTFSDWVTNIKGVPQGSILGPLLFNIFINDLLYLEVNSKIYNYADDNTLSFTHTDIKEIHIKLKADCLKVMNWFQINNMKANADKFQVMFLYKKDSEIIPSLEIGDCSIQASSSIKILGIEIDDKLNYDIQANDTCNQASKQVNALKRMKHYVDKECKTLIYNSYISSNFNYCPIVWMFSSKANLDKMDKTNKRAMRFLTNDHESNYEDLCKQEKQLNVYRKCIKAVAIQMFKIKNGLSPDYVNELFTRREVNYEMRDSNNFNIPRYKTVKYGKRSLIYYAPKLWTNLPIHVKDAISLRTFKSAVTKWLQELDDISNINFL